MSTGLYRILSAQRLSERTVYDTKSWEWGIFATLEKAESSTEIIRGLKLAAIMHTTIQVSDPAVV